MNINVIIGVYGSICLYIIWWNYIRQVSMYKFCEYNTFLQQIQATLIGIGYTHFYMNTSTLDWTNKDYISIFAVRNKNIVHPYHVYYTRSPEGNLTVRSLEAASALKQNVDENSGQEVISDFLLNSSLL